jgi:hypothetical protein
MPSLGRSDDLFEHYGDRGKQNKSSIIGEEFVVSRGDAPELFQLVEKAFDEVALFVEGLVVGERRAAIEFGRDDRLSLACKDSFAQVIGVITLVGDDRFGRKTLDQGVRLGNIVALTWPKQ